MPEPSQVDSSIPRGKAVFHAILPALGFVVGGEAGGIIAAGTGALMAASVLGGPRYSLIGLLYKKVVRRLLNIGPGDPEAAAPHRFAEAVGAIFLLASGGFYLAGAGTVGGTLSLIVVALATLNAAAGICVGCQMYTLFKRLGAKVTA